MQIPANAMAAPLPPYAKSLAFGAGLNRRADIAEVATRQGHGYALFKALLRHVQQALRLRRNPAHPIGDAGISAEALVLQADVNPHDIAFSQHAFIWQAVADLGIDRSTDHAGKGWVRRRVASIP